jgi:hypothetical protein
MLWRDSLRRLALSPEQLKGDRVKVLGREPRDPIGFNFTEDRASAKWNGQQTVQMVPLT